MQEIGIYVIQTLGGLYAGVCVLRVLLQLVQADYYNQISQFIVTATRAPIQVLRPALPNWGRLDIAALVWAILVGYLIFQISALIAGVGIVEPLLSIAWAFMGMLRLCLNILFYGMIGVIVISWLTLMGGMRISHPAINLMEQIVRPFMAPFQRILPPFGGIDLSPILLFLAIQVALRMTIEVALTLGSFGRYGGLVVGF
ncbi:MAG: YggT family protein [Porticoccaceae bacterium]|jgi:YggT family protein|nr:YggT family protein [Porticoccaceae bacterium]